MACKTMLYICLAWGWLVHQIWELLYRPVRGREENKFEHLGHTRFGSNPNWEQNSFAVQLLILWYCETLVCTLVCYVLMVLMRLFQGLKCSLFPKMVMVTVLNMHMSFGWWGITRHMHIHLGDIQDAHPIQNAHIVYEQKYEWMTGHNYSFLTKRVVKVVRGISKLYGI